jgi:hypothetical protein
LKTKSKLALLFATDTRLVLVESVSINLKKEPAHLIFIKIKMLNLLATLLVANAQAVILNMHPKK